MQESQAALGAERCPGINHTGTVHLHQLISGEKIILICLPLAKGNLRTQSIKEMLWMQKLFCKKADKQGTAVVLLPDFKIR